MLQGTVQERTISNAASQLAIPAPQMAFVFGPEAAAPTVSLQISAQARMMFNVVPAV
jgi:hypothetical protein